MTSTLLILGDQLLDRHPGLTINDIERVLIVEVVIASYERLYHRKRLALLLSAMRHYSKRLKEAGFEVDYRQAYRLETGVQDHITEFSVDRLFVMDPDSYWVKNMLDTWSQTMDVEISVMSNTKMLRTREEFANSLSGLENARQENFYRRMRSLSGILMKGNNSPEGGKWNFDSSNRKPLPKNGLTITEPLKFEPDEITIQVLQEIDIYDHAFGSLEGFDLAVDSHQAELAVNDFVENRLSLFGRYEDAMTTSSDLVFHSGLSAYMNLGLIDPLALCKTVEEAYVSGKVPIESAEGFIRQVIGWREYMHFKYSRLMPSLESVNSWNHVNPLPKFWWTGQTDMTCVKSVVDKVIKTGYSHHIERLMILTNFAFVAELDPLEVNEWFNSVYIDAYDWVVTPNVMGMGLNADGGTIATKPYFSSANYINRMSDYCSSCRYDPKKRTGKEACPFNFLFWRKVEKERERLSHNFRSRMMVRQWDRMDESEQYEIFQNASAWLERIK